VSGPAAAVAAVRVAVRRALVDVPDGSVVLVACSGGPDSLALAAGLVFEARGGRAPGGHAADERGSGARWRAGAVVVDHGLQAGSDEVARRAAAACRGLGLDPVLVVPVAVRGPGGPEAAARAARYAALEQVADEHAAAAVLLGHTLDDQAETVLLGLARGSGPRSLAGMAARRGVFRRPLLALSRADTVAACQAQGLDPWHDPTNGAGPGAPLRSRVRGEVLPVLEEVLGPGVAGALARTADLAREQADALDDVAGALLAETGTPDGGWDAASLSAAPDGLRRAALHRAALAAGVPAGSLTRGHVLALDALVCDWRGQGAVTLPGGLAGLRRCGRLFLQQPPSDQE